MVGTRLATLRRWGLWDVFRFVDYDKNMILILGFAVLDCGPGREKVVAGVSHRTAQGTGLRKQLFYGTAGYERRSRGEE